MLPGTAMGKFQLTVGNHSLLKLRRLPYSSSAGLGQSLAGSWGAMGLTMTLPYSQGLEGED